MPVLKKLLQSFKRFFRRKRTPTKANRTRQKPRKPKHPSKVVNRAKRKAVFKITASKKSAAKAKKIKNKPKPFSKSKAQPKSSKLLQIRPRKEILIGEVTHYFNKIEVIVIKMKSGTLSVGEEIHIKGSGNGFTQKVGSLQIESVDVKVVRKGQLAGLKVKDKAKVGALVYKLLK